MSLAAPIEYTDAAQMLADYAARRKALYAQRQAAPSIAVAPTKPAPPEPFVIEDWPQPIELPHGPKRQAKRILAETAEKHGLKIECVIGPRRYPELVRCRREAAWLIARDTPLSLPQIGAILGKDHTTVLMAIRRHNEATGENVRGTGGVPLKTYERNLESARRSRRKSTKRQRMRSSELKRNREDFRL